ncbi:hypothetical protein M885DRAFT_569156 [Pelagophyceae sp. CCMP2097]|nr:hypothetical protein M885DRAFT_569156 [Pelagophyceae sp. CCMP2097]
MLCRALLVWLVSLHSAFPAASFGPPRLRERRERDAMNDDARCAASVSRRDTIRKLTTLPVVAASSLGPAPAPAKTWISGKNPDGPAPAGETKGTKKDYGYLQCLSQCLARCQKPTTGPEKERAQCLGECRDECCSTYEQCSQQ